MIPTGTGYKGTRTHLQVLPSLPDRVPLQGPLGPLVSSPRVRLDDDAVDRLQGGLGVDGEGYFTCPLPGHRGNARLHHEGDEVWLGCCSGRLRSLAEVRAARAYGVDRRRSNKELAAWWRRLAFDLGVVEPVAVHAPDLPEGAPREAHVARDGFLLLMGLRRIDYRPEPVAFSVNFVAAWCGLSRRLAERAIRELVDRRVIRVVGRCGRTPLYEPGGHGDERNGREPSS
jgi:hypothetical protein